MLVPYAAMLALTNSLSSSNPLASSDWQKNPTPPSTLNPYPAKGCAESTTNFSDVGDLPDAYEVLVGCPTAQDIAKLWSDIHWSQVLLASWKPSSAFGSYAQQSKTFVQHYVYDSDGDACWAYLTVFTERNVMGLSGLCDFDSNPLAETRSEAQAWATLVVERIEFVQRIVG